MSSKIPKNQYSNKILKTLSEKQAVSVEEITTPKPLINKEEKYAIARSVKNLVKSGCAEIIKSDNKNYLKITQKGKNKINSLNLEAENILVPTVWDGFWRIIILDLPENRKSERESLRYLLKKAGFTCIKNTVWVSTLPYENLFMNIKKDLNLGTELMIIVTDKFFR